MADQAAVEQALTEAVAGAVFPGGAGPAVGLGVVCRVYRGVPVTAALEADLVRGIAHVTVQPVVGSVRDRTRYGSEWIGGAPACPLVADTDGERVLFRGDAGPGMVAGVRVDGGAYAWRVTEACSAGVVAAVLADLVRVVRPAQLSGSTVRFPGGVGVLGRTACDGQGGQEVRRQRETFRVTLWCPTPSVRDRLGAFVDLSLAGVAFLDVGGWGCRVRGVGSSVGDDGAVVRSFRRELLYTVEYPTVQPVDLPSMLFGVGSVNGAGYLG